MSSFEFNDDLLKDSAPSIESQIKNKLRFRSQAKVFYWLGYQFIHEKQQIVYAKELAERFGFTLSRGYQLLHEFELLGLLQKDDADLKTMAWTPTLQGDGKPVLEKYLMYAEKTLRR